MDSAMTATAWQLVVMGVSGCGKSTLAARLAQQLALDMVDGDDLHLPESVAKMRAGIALEDEDRWPWLERIGRCLDAPPEGTQGRVVACSALKQMYRDRIRQHAARVLFVFLDGSSETIRQRLSARVGHYMPPELLSSQLSTLERPTAQESDVIRLDLAADLESLTEQAINALQVRASNLQYPHPETGSSTHRP